MSTTCGCEHCHSHGSSGLWMPTVSFVLLVIGLIGKYSGISWFAESWIEAIWFLVAFLPVGLPVMREAWEAALRKDFFSEFSLMAIASIGAFCIGEYPEAVAVMLFYTVGERLQLLAVNKASKNISDLLDVRPERTDVWRTGTYMNVSPKDRKRIYQSSRYTKMLLYPRQDFSDLHINNEHTSSSYAWCHYCRYGTFCCWCYPSGRYE